LLQMLK